MEEGLSRIKNSLRRGVDYDHGTDSSVRAAAGDRQTVPDILSLSHHAQNYGDAFTYQQRLHDKQANQVGDVSAAWARVARLCPRTLERRGRKVRDAHV